MLSDILFACPRCAAKLIKGRGKYEIESTEYPDSWQRHLTVMFVVIGERVNECKVLSHVALI